MNKLLLNKIVVYKIITLIQLLSKLFVKCALGLRSKYLRFLTCLIIGCVVCVCPQVSLVLSALQAGNKGTQACITAASAVSGIIADLDTTIMFASAGTLNAEDDESFADHRLELEKDWTL